MALSLNDLFEAAEKAPCFQKLTEIAEKEVVRGNVIMSFDKSISSPDETYYLLLFREPPKGYYNGMKMFRKKNGAEYQSIVLTDNTGCVEVRFNY